MDDTGCVSCIAWTPDNSAFAVGWKLRGLTVWSVSGCRLMSTIRQIGLSSVSSPVNMTNQECKFEPLMGGTSSIQWDEYGYRLYAIEEGSSERILAFSFGKCCLNRGVSGTTYSRQVIYGDDRLLIVQSEETNGLKVLHLNLPVKTILLFLYYLLISKWACLTTSLYIGILYFSELACAACGSQPGWNVFSSSRSSWVDTV